jgi:hypothetical protein
MINLEAIRKRRIETVPYRWAAIDGLFTRSDARRLARHYPHDHFKTVEGYDGEKSYHYEVRALIHMDAKEPAHAENLHPAWRRLALDLLSHEYRRAMSDFTGCDLARAPLEVNVFHFGCGAWLGPHVDLKDKIVTHVFYFNEQWDPEQGGCLSILRSRHVSDVHAIVEPIIGGSAVIVRANDSWHSVGKINDDCKSSRRSMTVTFHHPGTVSTMWQAGIGSDLHDFIPPSETRQRPAFLSGLRRRVSRWRAIVGR